MCRRPWRELLQTQVGQARPLALHLHGSLGSETFSTSRECVWAGATHLGSADAPEPAQVFNTDSSNDLNLNRQTKKKQIPTNG